jgi:hypothetical protein
MENKHLELLIFRLERLQPLIAYYFKNQMTKSFEKNIFSEPVVSFIVIELYSFFDAHEESAGLVAKEFVLKIINDTDDIKIFLKEIKDLKKNDNYEILKLLRNKISAHKNVAVGVQEKEIDKLNPAQLEFLYLQLFYSIDKYIDISLMENYNKIKNRKDNEHLSDIIDNPK